jgi:hypothetical protein
MTRVGGGETAAAGAPKPKQRRYRATPEQLRDLMVLFDKNPSPPASELNELATRISMPTQSVVLWFKNRRARVPHKKAGGVAEHAGVHRPTNVVAQDHSMPGFYRPDPPTISRDQLTSSTAYPSTPIEISQNLPSPGVPPIDHSSSIRMGLKDPSASPTVGTTHEVAAALLGFSQGHSAQRVRALGETSFIIGSELGLADNMSGDRSRRMRTSLMAEERGTRCHPKEAPGRDSSGPLFVGASKGDFSFVGPVEAVPDIVEVHHRVPFTPRVRGQRVYMSGDKVEVLESTEAPSRAWLPARIVGLAPDSRTDAAGANRARRMDAEPLSLGESVACEPYAKKDSSLLTPVTPSENMQSISMVWKDSTQIGPNKLRDQLDREQDRSITSGAMWKSNGLQNEEGSSMHDTSFSRRFVSPRRSTAPFPAPSPSRANSNMLYIVEFGHDLPDLPEEGLSPRTAVLTREVVSGSRIRPQPPSVARGMTSEGEMWRPYVGQAVEILVGSTWRVAEVRSRAHSKGFQTRQEDGTICWSPLERLRPIRKWKGEEQWVTSTKPPVTLLKQATDFVDEEPTLLESDDDGRTPSSSPHSPSFESEMNTESGPEIRIRKRRREESSSLDGLALKHHRTAMSRPGPDGLPSGWRCEKVERAAGILASRVDSFYVAPDGRRHRSLREAQRYATQNR